jgi:hypothetical protein
MDSQPHHTRLQSSEAGRSLHNALTRKRAKEKHTLV